MSRIFISGSSAGLGLMAASLLAARGHDVVIHARNAARAEDAQRALAKESGSKAMAVVLGDLETIAGAKDVAAEVNALGGTRPGGIALGETPRGGVDAVIHNAAVGYREEHRLTADGLPHVFAINTLSAYILTALIERPIQCGTTPPDQYCFSVVPLALRRAAIPA